MPTQPVRKFAISIDPDEVVDFEEDLPYFAEHFTRLGFEQIGAYRFRYLDRECTITTELKNTHDGFEVWAHVQAPDQHAYRLEEIANALCASVLAAPSSHGSALSTASSRIRRQSTSR